MKISDIIGMTIFSTTCTFIIKSLSEKIFHITDNFTIWQISFLFNILWIAPTLAILLLKDKP